MPMTRWPIARAEYWTFGRRCEYRENHMQEKRRREEMNAGKQGYGRVTSLAVRAGCERLVIGIWRRTDDFSQDVCLRET